MRRILVLAVAGALVACVAEDEGADSEATNTPAPSEALDIAPEAPQETQAASAPDAALTGEMCWFSDDAETTEGLRIVFADTGVTGEHFGVIHNHEAAYFAAFDTEMRNGRMDVEDITQPGEWAFDTLTHVDGDTQEGLEVWRITPEVAGFSAFDDHNLTTADCANLETRVYGEPLD